MVLGVNGTMLDIYECFFYPINTTINNLEPQLLSSNNIKLKSNLRHSTAGELFTLDLSRKEGAGSEILVEVKEVFVQLSIER